MPRRSTDSLAVVASISEARPAPPQRLTPEQREIWDAVTAALPTGWFRKESFALLEAYTQHVATARRLATLIDSFEASWLATDEGLDRFSKLATARERETRAVVNLSRQMRLSQQARFMPNTAARAASREPTGQKPWEGYKVG